MNNRRIMAVATSAVVALTLSSCAQSERDSGDSADGSAASGGSAAGDDTFVFGAAGAPATFDPFYASDGETFRVSRQIFENLIGMKEGGTEAVPELATKWEGSEDGKTWTFTLQDGVKFHDGTPFDAEAVCANFERWADQNEAGQNPSAAYYFGNDFGFGKDSLYDSCKATDDLTAEVTLTRETGKFPMVLSQTAYSIQSPTAMDKYKANDIKVQGEGFDFPEYADSHPTGTGPFKFASYDGTTEVVLERNEDYWGDKAGVAKLIFRIISDETTRRQELQSGTIQGYDLPNPVDWKDLEADGNQVLIRDPFNILYLALNPVADPQLKDLKVRQALYHAINRDELVKSQLPEGATVATQFMPDTVAGYNKDVQPYDYDVEKAKSLLKEAGKEGLTVELWYPSEVSRPYMPNPQAIYDAVKSDWEAAGITVKTVTKPWNGGYIDQVQASKAPAFFLGWTGDLNYADNFVCNFFCGDDNQFGTSALPFHDELQKAMRAADGESDEAKRDQMYSDLNQKIMEEWLPGLPISHAPPAIVVAGNVKGLVPSPLTAEKFDTVTLDK